MANYLTKSSIQTLKVGDSVVFPDGAEAYPSFYLWGERLTGKVSEMDSDCVWIKLDQHKDELTEWDNQIQVWLWEEGEQLAHNIERSLSTEDGTLDRYIQSYCNLFNIEIDGDVFGMMFSEPDRVWTDSEAIELIEEGARIYGLRR